MHQAHGGVNAMRLICVTGLLRTGEILPTTLAAAPTRAIAVTGTTGPPAITATVRLGIDLAHGHHVVETLLLQIGFQLRQLFAETTRHGGIRRLFGQFTAQVQIFLINFLAKLGRVCKKGLPLFIHLLELLGCQSGTTVIPSGPSPPGPPAATSAPTVAEGYDRPRRRFTIPGATGRNTPNTPSSPLFGGITARYTR